MATPNKKLSRLWIVSLIAGCHISAYSEQTQDTINPPPSFIKSLEWPKLSTNTNELWRGTYLGLRFAAGSGVMNENSNINSTLTTSSLSSSGSGQITTLLSNTTGYSNGNLTGSEADVFIGYNFHRKNWGLIWGGQLEGTIFDNFSAKTIGTSILASTTTTKNLTNNVVTSTTVSRQSQTSVLQRRVDIQSMFSFLGRGGCLLDPKTYLYGLIGGTESHMVVPELTTLSSSSSDTTGSIRNWWVLGWTTGAGLEYKITEHWSFLGEFRYLRLHYSLNWQNPSSLSNASSSQTSSSNSTNDLSSQATLNLNLGKIGVVYRI